MIVFRKDYCNNTNNFINLRYSCIFNYFCKKNIKFMIQRIQSLILLMAGLCSTIIIFYFPVLKNDTISIYLTNDLFYARLFIILSVGLNIFTIFQYRNRNRQIIINQVSKLLLSTSFIIIVFQRSDMHFSLGLFLYIIPYILMIFSNYLIRKDAELVKSADRIR